jgi:hypothetical protein
VSKLLWIVASLFGGISVSTCMGGPISYTVYQTVGAGNVSGFIETDGTIGTLANGDLLNWILTLNDGTGSASLLGPLSGDNSGVSIFGNNVTATATLLEFNFNGTGGFMDIYDFATCSPPEWSFETTGSGSGCNGTTGDEEGIAAVLPAGSGTYTLQSGEVVFATVGTVPEPSTFGPMLIVMLGVTFVARRGAEKFAATRSAR